MRITKIWLLSLLLISSCINEYIPEEPGSQIRLVVLGELMAESPNQTIYVSTSFTDFTDPLQLGPELRVEIFENNNPEAFVLTQDTSNNLFWNCPEDLILKGGESYFIKMDPTYYNLDPIQSELRVPLAVQFTIHDYQHEMGHNNIRIDLELAQNLSQTRYLHLELNYMNEEGERTALPVHFGFEEFNAVVPLNNRNGTLIDYESLSEGKYLSFYADFSDSVPLDSLKGKFIYISLKSVTEDYYLYNRSLSNSTDTDQNPFSLPNSTFSNISNGLGLFSAYSVVSDSLLIE